MKYCPIDTIYLHFDNTNIGVHFLIHGSMDTGKHTVMLPHLAVCVRPVSTFSQRDKYELKYFSYTRNLLFRLSQYLPIVIQCATQFFISSSLPKGDNGGIRCNLQSPSTNWTNSSHYTFTTTACTKHSNSFSSCTGLFPTYQILYGFISFPGWSLCLFSKLGNYQSVKLDRISINGPD